MDFIDINWKKIIGIFLACYVSSILLFGFIYVMRLDKMDSAERDESKFMLPLLATGVTLFLFSLFVFGGLYQFYKARSLLSFIVSLQLFDSGIFHKEFRQVESWLFYTRECLCGQIDGYPAEIQINYAISKTYRTNIGITLMVRAFNCNVTKTASILLDFFDDPPKDTKDQILQFVAEIRMTGYEKCLSNDGLD